MLQTYIPYCSKNTTPINEKIAMDNEGVHYAGVLLALPFLAGLSSLDTGKKVYRSLVISTRKDLSMEEIAMYYLIIKKRSTCPGK